MRIINKFSSEDENVGTFTSKHLFKWLAIYLQIIVASSVIYYFQLEVELGLPRFWYFTIGLFFINSILPGKYRQLLLTVGFIGVLLLFLGIGGGLKVLLASLVVLGICHLPIAMIFRKLLVFLLGIALVAMVLGMIPPILNPYETRVFATIFMFRVILYLYELKHEKASHGILKRVNYFFLLPNIALPLFPIVDYQHYLNSYYNEDSTKIYQKGITMVLWSLICLLIYRLIYLFGVPNLKDVVGSWSVFHYVIANYLTVFRLIGLLTFSVGVLRMFGYNLPPIFNNMFLASSFSDLFKRINIYWKDFMTKICYIPLYFRFRKKYGAKAAMISVFITYLFTWFFHSYQWFWVLGINPFNNKDVIFWSVFGVFGTLNMVFESGSKTVVKDHKFFSVLIHSGKVMVTFISMSFLYAMWVSPSFNSWIKMVEIALNDSVSEWTSLVMVILGFWVVSGSVAYIYLNRMSILATYSSNQLLGGTSYSFALVFVGLLVFTQKVTYQPLALFKENNVLSIKDQESQFTGYYEKILSVTPNISSKLWGAKSGSKKKQLFTDLINVKPDHSMMLNEMVPNSSANYKDALFEVNEWGLRDQSYVKKAAPGTLRIAILGGSNVFGPGVTNHEVFENLVEKWLNENHGNDTTKFELINFAFPNTYAIQYNYLLEEKIKDFEPDYVINLENCIAFSRKFKNLKKIVNANVPLFPALDSLILSTPLKVNGYYSEAEKTKIGKLIAEFGLSYYRKLCSKYKIKPIWVYFPDIDNESYVDEYMPMVRKTGFEAIMNLGHVYDNYHKNLIRLNKDDRHPNKKGHELIAKALYKELELYLKLKSDNKNE